MENSREDVVTVVEIVDDVPHVPTGFSMRRLATFIGPGLLMSIAYVVGGFGGGVLCCMVFGGQHGILIHCFCYKYLLTPLKMTPFA